jgi:hypothetical protein
MQSGGVVAGAGGRVCLMISIEPLSSVGVGGSNNLRRGVREQVLNQLGSELDEGEME